MLGCVNAPSKLRSGVQFELQQNIVLRSVTFSYFSQTFHTSGLFSGTLWHFRISKGKRKTTNVNFSLR